MEPNVRAVWGVVLVVLVGLGAGASAAVLDALSGDSPRLAEATATARTPEDDGVVDLAGSGSNLPLTRLLAEAFNAQQGYEAVRLHESIGTRGGVRALLDHAVEMGLASRPLKPEEEAGGVRLLPYARVAVTLAANPSVPESRLEVVDLMAIYRGQRTTWSDGTSVVVFLRETGDSGQAALEAALPGFAEIVADARKDGRLEVLYRDIDMQEALTAVPGAVGLFDHGAIVAQGLPLRELTVYPDDASTPIPMPIKTLAFAVIGEATGLAAAFVEFVYSDAGQAIIGSHGYEPLGRGAR